MLLANYSSQLTSTFSSLIEKAYIKASLKPSWWRWWWCDTITELSSFFYKVIVSLSSLRKLKIIFFHLSCKSNKLQQQQQKPQIWILLNFIFTLHIFLCLQHACSFFCVCTSCEYKVTTSNAITQAYTITMLSLSLSLVIIHISLLIWFVI